MVLSPKAEIIISVLTYSLCSGSLVLVNKLILFYYLPFPSLVVTIQLLTTLLFIYSAHYCFALSIDTLKWECIKPYLIYTVAFSVGVYTNMKTLTLSNVETVIVFRALAPLLVSFMDAAFLGRELPSLRSLFALCLIAAGAFKYARTDAEFQEQGASAYLWPTLYLLAISFEMVYGKNIVKNVEFKTKSGPVQYTNLLGWPPMLLFAKLGGEFDKISEQNDGAGSFWECLTSLPLEGVMLLLLGCIVGTGIGYTGWWCRDKVSATSFTLVGVINKCLTVLANLFIWDQHAVLAGIVSLFLCIVGGAIYQQAPMRKNDGDETVAVQDAKDLELVSIDEEEASQQIVPLVRDEEEVSQQNVPLVRNA